MKNNRKTVFMTKNMRYRITMMVIFTILTVIYRDKVYADETTKKIEQPKVDAIGSVLMDYNTGRVLWERKSTEPLSNASTTKIMTAILTLEYGNLDEIVTVSKRAASAPEVNMNLQTGEEIKLQDLLYALMLQSSNDAAIAIAEHIGGTVEDFCIMMTEKAKILGCLDTVFKTPNGLDLDDHHSTAYDLALIAQYAMGNPKFVELINTRYAHATTNKGSHDITNKNRLLNEYEGGNGIKTGFTNKAGHCFVGSAVQGDMQLITVVLGSGWGDKGKEQKWVDTKNLLNYGFANYEYETLVEEGEVGEINVLRSKTPNLSYSLSENFVYPLNKNEIDLVRIEIEVPDEILAPATKGENIGLGKVYIGEELVREIPIVLDDSATRHDLKTSIEKIIKSWFELATNEDLEIILPEF